ncbi:MAG TPA: HAMP domain-containing sensor histidine kinase [Acidobacteriaceae bacterium]
MNRKSLRYRITSFFVGFLALALVVSSIAVYLGVRAFLTRSLEQTLANNARNIATDYLAQRNIKGNGWFLGELTEAYPPGLGNQFVRISQGGKVLFDSGDMRDPYVSTSKLPMPSKSAWVNAIHRETAASGQRLMIYTLAYRTSDGSQALVENGATIESIRHVLRTLFVILLVTTPVILIVASIGGYALMSHLLLPVVVLTDQAERIGRKDVGERLPVIRSGDELERLSLSLNRMIERLEDTLAHNHRFSADASHELRTPLTIIRGQLEELTQRSDLSAAAKDGIGSALEEADRMSRIVESLMTITRLDCGGERIQMIPVDLMAMASTTVEHMHLLADEKNISLLCKRGLPVYVIGDPMRLKQVMVNLLDNAIKYTPSGGAVTVNAVTEGERAVVSVSDTGIGIPEEAVPFIFDRFYRADKGRSRDSGGVGLGLAIVKSICTAHDAAISVQNGDGRGTTMQINLPLLRPSPSQINDTQKAVERGPGGYLRVADDGPEEKTVQSTETY